MSRILDLIESKNMKQYIIIKLLAAIFLGGICFSCSNSGDMLDDIMSQGPIIYSAKVDTLICQSGYYRLRVNIYPLEDVNRDYCLLSWNVTSEKRDSMKVYYQEENYDNGQGCYYSILDLKENNIQGNLEIKAQNVDVYGNKSLIYSSGAYVYGDIYISTLLNDAVFIEGLSIRIDRKIGSIGNYIAYERTDGSFSDEVFFTGDTYLITDAKSGGIVRTKTKFLINKSDIDELQPTHYLETIIP